MKHVLTLLAFALMSSGLAQIPEYVPLDGLVAWYPFNGNAEDESTFGNEAMVVGAHLTDDRFGIADHAYHFDGDDHIESPHKPWLNFADSSYTLAGWGRKSEGNDHAHFITKIGPQGEFGSYLRFAPDNQVEIGEGGPQWGNSAFCSGFDLSSEWVHLVGVKDLTAGEMKLFLNGVEVCSSPLQSLNLSASNTGQLYIGCEEPYIYLPSGPQYFYGDLDDLGIWDRVLSSEEILALYHAPAPTFGCTDPFASNYNLGEGACTYCESTTELNSFPEEEFTIGSGLSNDHMNVGIDWCNGITTSLGVLERYVGNVEPETGNLTNYQVNTGFADVPEGAEAGARWNYLLSVNLGEHVFEDVDVKFGLDFDPADDFNGEDLEGSYTIFGSFSEAFPLVETETGIDYSQQGTFQDSQNFDFGFWSQLAEGADVDFDPNDVGVYNLGVYVHSLEGALLASSEISVETLADEVYGCTIFLACNYNPEATINDSSCDFTGCLVFGCNDVSACNFDPEVNVNDGTCVYAQAPYDCDDFCVLALPDTVVQCFNSSTQIESGVQRGTFFDGVDDWILTSESGVTGMNPMSVSFWALTDHNGAMDIFTQATDDDSWADIRFGMNTPQCGLVGPSFKSPSHFATFPFPVDNRNWHHYVYVLGDGSMSFSNMKIYVDGELHPASTGEDFCGHNWGGWTYDAADVPIRLGVGLPLGGFYSGYLDDMALWSKALAQDEVVEIMDNDATVVSDDLVSFWPLDQLEDGFFLDVVGANHGAPVGGIGTEAPFPQGVVTWFNGSQMPNLVVTPNQTTAYGIQSTLESGQVCVDTTVVEVIDFEFTDLNGNGVCDQLESEGCMDPTACNFSEFTITDDGSCEFSCCPGPGCCSLPNVWDPTTQMCISTAASCGANTVWDELLGECVGDITPSSACGPGTYWDDEGQECIIMVPSDTDFDGCVSMPDLLDLLTVFGTCTEVEPELGDWSCGDPLEYRGYDYATVQIGDRCWFAENLRTSSYRNGEQLLGGLSDEQWSNATEGAQCAFADNEANVPITGRLYNYIAVVDDRGVCPSGWHVPVDAEWVHMANSLGGVEVAGLAMKNSESDYPSWDGTNSSGFSGAPGGKREMNGVFGGGSVGYWWTSTPLGCGGWHRNLHLGNDALTLSSYCDVVGFSVRCIQDSE